MNNSEPTNETDPAKRNFSTISPSAKSLLMMKGLTNIPFAQEAAILMTLGEKVKDPGFLTRVLHFESRYRSIDQLLSDLPVKNILELSSGFSFRSLETVKKSGFHYIDTDLPEVIASKKELIATMQYDEANPESELEILPLNALDETAFSRIIDRFPPGEVAVVNEGLLMYLNRAEKEILCGIIHRVLQKRGGYWITADIYLKKPYDTVPLAFDEREKRFFEEHRIEENKFVSFEEAESFFNDAGFVVDREAVSDVTKLSSLRYLMIAASPEQLQKMQKAGKIQATWRLKINDR